MAEMTSQMTKHEARGSGREVGRPNLLIAGAFLSESTGVRSVCEDLAAGLEGRGWRIITTSPIKSKAPRLLDMLKTVWIHRGDYAVAQMDVYSGSAFLWAEAVAYSLNFLRCPWVATLHSGAFPDFAKKYPGRMRRLLRSAAIVTSPSPFLAEQMAQFRPDIRVVRNGLNLGLYPVRVLQSAAPRLVWIRAFERRYNPVMALEAVQLLAGEFPDIELLMVGPDRADWSARETLGEAQRLGIADRVNVMGSVEKTAVPTILQRGDIFLNTTNVDNAPVTVVEAMACGLCVVSTDAGGVPKLVRNGTDALLVPRGDAEAMAAAIRRLLREPDLAASLSRNGRSTADEFDWSRILPAWEMILTEAAQG